MFKCKSCPSACVIVDADVGLDNGAVPEVCPFGGPCKAVFEEVEL